MQNTHEKKERHASNSEFDWKSIIIISILSVIILIIAGANAKFGLLPTTVSYALVALSISLVLFGILDSAANVTLDSSSKFPLGKTISLGGAIAGFYVIFMLLSNNEDQDSLEAFDVNFAAPIYLETEKPIFDKEKLRITQSTPISTYRDYPIVPVSLFGTKWAKYTLKERHLNNIEDHFEVSFRRDVNNTYYEGDLSSLPKYKICFLRTLLKPVVAQLECKAENCTLLETSQSIEACDTASTMNEFKLFNQAYAATRSSGWIAPSLDTLKSQYESTKNTYVEFTISAKDLNLPLDVNSYAFQLIVNGTPLYINGWLEKETQMQFDPNKPFSLSFGMQNLDFSGADYGQENLTLRLTFYSGNQVARSDVISRKHVALRSVSDITINTGETKYNWIGKQFFGDADAFEVFFWSSTNSDELVNRRKKFFDEEDITFKGKEVVAVIRPPLKKNEHFGLVIGLKDELGRVDFTFPKQKAETIAKWVNSDLKGKRTQIRPETGFDHPLVKKVNIYQLNGEH